jgi:integrase
VAEKRGFGEIERLPSGRIRARYTGPDLRRHSAPITFETRLDAEAWLVDERRLIASGEWLPTDRRGVPQVTSDLTFGEYAETWLAERAIKPTTYERYRLILKYDLLPPYGPIPMRAISPESIRTWHAKYGSTKPTARSQAYSLLRTILGTAVTDGLLGANPCHIRGAGNVKRVHKVEPATLAELEVMTNALPPRYRLMLLLAAWCAMRFGELAELRRKDLDLVNDVVRIRRAVVKVRGEFIIGTPKTDAGTRDVAIPPHLMPAVRAHFDEHTASGKESLLFPAKQGEHMATASLYRVWYPGP